MCKFCEMPEKMDKRESNEYGEPNWAFVIYRRPGSKYTLGCEFEDTDGRLLWENVDIEYCPYCGRKLGRE